MAASDRSHGTSSDGERIAFSVVEFGRRAALSRSLIYLAINRGELPSVKIHGRRLILAEDGLAWLRAHRGATS